MMVAKWVTLMVLVMGLVMLLVQMNTLVLIGTSSLSTTYIACDPVCDPVLVPGRRFQCGRMHDGCRMECFDGGEMSDLDGFCRWFRCK